MLLGPTPDRLERLGQRSPGRGQGVSTVTGTVGFTRRVTSPSSSRLRRVCVNIFWEMPSIARRSSPNRCVRRESDPMINTVHLSAIRSRACATDTTRTGMPSTRSRNMKMIGVTGATGQLGRLVVSGLKARVPASEIVALVRTPAKAENLGVAVREADYSKPETLDRGFRRNRHAPADLVERSGQAGRPAPQRDRGREEGRREVDRLHRACSMPTGRRSAWPTSTSRPRTNSRRRAYRPRSCATGGTPRTTRPRSLGPWRVARSSAVRATAGSRLPRARTTLTPPSPC